VFEPVDIAALSICAQYFDDVIALCFRRITAYPAILEVPTTKLRKKYLSIVTGDHAIS